MTVLEIDDPVFEGELNSAFLAQHAEQRTWQKGNLYYQDGRVKQLARQKNSLHAIVQGSQEYQVDLWYSDGVIGYRCSCPVGQREFFCKHLVAVVQAWIEHCRRYTKSNAPDFYPHDIQWLEQYLNGLMRSSLVDIILQQVRRDPELRRGLLDEGMYFEVSKENDE